VSQYKVHSTEDQKHPRKILAFSIKIVISLCILGFIFYKIGVAQIVTEFSQITILPLLIAIAITPLTMLFRAARWKYVLNNTHENISFTLLLKLTYISITLGLITPGRIGEFSKVHYLAKKTHITKKKALYTALVDKLLDVVVIIPLALLGVYFLLYTQKIVLLTFILLFVISLLFFIPYNIMLRYSNYIPFIKKYAHLLKSYKISQKSSYLMVAVSYAIWLSLALQAYIILQMIGVSSFSFIVIVGVISLMAISSFIPITIGGVGVRDAIAIGLFTNVGVIAAKSALFSLLYTFVSYGWITAIGSYYIITFKKK